MSDLLPFSDIKVSGTFTHHWINHQYPVFGQPKKIWPFGKELQAEALVVIIEELFLMGRVVGFTQSDIAPSLINECYPEAIWDEEDIEFFDDIKF